MKINNNKYLRKLTVIPAEIANEKGFIVETNNLKINIYEFEKFKYNMYLIKNDMYTKKPALICIKPTSINNEKNIFGFFITKNNIKIKNPNGDYLYKKNAKFIHIDLDSDNKYTFKKCKDYIFTNIKFTLEECRNILPEYTI